MSADEDRDLELINVSDEDDGNQDAWSWPNSLLNYAHFWSATNPYLLNPYSHPLSLAASSTSTTTTTTATAATNATNMIHEQCCICLNSIVQGGVNLHGGVHPIHIFCLLNYLTNSPSSAINWLDSSFCFYCPLCRSPVCGSIIL